jgi:hypothetical protein
LFISDLARNKNWVSAWKARFRVKPSVIEKQFRKWWLEVSVKDRNQAYQQAMVETLASFLARSKKLKLTFATAEEFFAAARSGKFDCDPKKLGTNWLPNSLLQGALQQARKYKWTLEIKSSRYILSMTDASGMQIVARYAQGSKGVIVTCKIIEPDPQKDKKKRAA